MRQRQIHQIGPFEIVEGIHDFASQALEAISEGDAVYLNASGQIAPAQANASGTMHAVGVAIHSIASGQIGATRILGSLNSTNYNFSGFYGKQIYVDLATAGALTGTPPAASGDIIQSIGIAVAEQNLIVNPGQAAQRGGGLY